MEWLGKVSLTIRYLTEVREEAVGRSGKRTLVRYRAQHIICKGPGAELNLCCRDKND